MYVKVKRNFNQVSRLAATRMVVEEPDKNYQYKIIEIENDRNRILAKCQDYELKINSLEENYLALEREYERIRTIYANNKLCLKDRDWEIAQLTKQVTALETELANKTNYEIKYLELKSTIEKLELEFNVEKNKKITLEQTDGKNIQNELHSEC
jgi:chromosome segregation ATPase